MKWCPIALAVSFAMVTASAPAAEPDAVGPNEVAGTVTDESGKPIAGVVVDAWTWYSGNEVTTGADGRFRLGGISGMRNRALGRDIVELRFSKAGLSPVYFRSQPLGVADLGVRMNARTYIEGKVLSPEGRPLPKVSIRADSGPKYVEAEGFRLTDIWTETESDAEGKYRLYVAPDRYKIHVRVPTSGVALVEVTAPENEAVAQDIKLEEGVRFVVKCVDGDADAPAPGVTVSAGRRRGISATSDKDGLATFEHMPADKFEFNVSSASTPGGGGPTRRRSGSGSGTRTTIGVGAA